MLTPGETHRRVWTRKGEKRVEKDPAKGTARQGERKAVYPPANSLEDRRQEAKEQKRGEKKNCTRKVAGKKGLKRWKTGGFS